MITIQELENILAPYAALPLLQCDGMTRVIDYLLTKNEIRHFVREGVIIGKGKRVYHYWIEVTPDDVAFPSELLTIDFKAKMWLGDYPDVPHGVFDPRKYPNVEYYRNRTILLNTSYETFHILTNLQSLTPKMAQP